MLQRDFSKKARNSTGHLFVGAILVIAHLLIGQAAAEDSIRDLSPPIRKTTLLVDGQIETPAVYNGGPTASLPKQGDTVEFQVFVPEAAGRTAFGCVLEFDNVDHAFADNFQIKSASAWVLIFPQETPEEISRPVLVQRDMAPLSDTGCPGCCALFVDRPRVPPDGLVATFVLEAKRDIPSDLPLKLTVSATVISRTPPTRLWNMQAQQMIGWAP